MRQTGKSRALHTGDSGTDVRLRACFACAAHLKPAPPYRCFPGSALRTLQFPTVEQPLALEAEAVAFGFRRPKFLVEVLVDQNNIKALRGPFPNAALIPTSAGNVLNVCEDSPLSTFAIGGESEWSTFPDRGQVARKKSQSLKPRALVSAARFPPRGSVFSHRYGSGHRSILGNACERILDRCPFDWMHARHLQFSGVNTSFQFASYGFSFMDTLQNVTDLLQEEQMPRRAEGMFDLNMPNAGNIFRLANRNDRIFKFGRLAKQLVESFRNNLVILRLHHVRHDAHGTRHLIGPASFGARQEDSRIPFGQRVHNFRAGNPERCCIPSDAELRSVIRQIDGLHIFGSDARNFCYAITDVGEPRFPNLPFGILIALRPHFHSGEHAHDLFLRNL